MSWGKAGSRGKDCFGFLPSKRGPGRECQVNGWPHPTLSARLLNWGHHSMGQGVGDSFSFLSADLRGWVEVEPSTHWGWVRGSQQTGPSKTNSSCLGSVLSFLLKTFFKSPPSDGMMSLEGVDTWSLPLPRHLQMNCIYISAAFSFGD